MAKDSLSPKASHPRKSFLCAASPAFSLVDGRSGAGLHWQGGGEAVKKLGQHLLHVRVILSSMPRPRSERQAWEEEHMELQAQLAAWQQDLAATPSEQRERRESAWTGRSGERGSGWRS